MTNISAIKNMSVEQLACFLTIVESGESWWDPEAYNYYLDFLVNKTGKSTLEAVDTLLEAVKYKVNKENKDGSNNN